MPYYCRMISKDVLEVEDRMPSFTGTKITFWYYNLVTKMRSVLGKQGEIPSAHMTACDEHWVQTYYLPKVETK